MRFKEILSKLVLPIKLVGLSLILPLNFFTTNSTTAVTLPTVNQHIKTPSVGKNEDFLIAASTQLNQLFDASVFSSFPNVKEMRGNYSYEDAYNNAWSWFDYITTGPIRGPYWSNEAGWVYVADLIGGGTANIREYGSSGLWPTIDTLNHYTVSPNGFVKEVKFKY